MSDKSHSHVYEGKKQGFFETRTWFVMILTLCSMILEIVCGILFGSLALVADGIHMGTHCLAFFLTAYSYSYSRKHANDKSFVFGTGKVTELASYTSALILLGVAAIIMYEAGSRFLHPQSIYFWEALPIAFVGLSVNIASGFLLMCRCQRGSTDDEHSNDVEMSHGHSHGHVQEYYQVDNDEPDDEEKGHHDHHADHDETFTIETADGTLVLSIFEEGVPPEFRIHFQNWKGKAPNVSTMAVETVRDDGSRQTFGFTRWNAAQNGGYRSTTSIPEPHQFRASVSYVSTAGVKVTKSVDFVEHDDHSHGHHSHHQQQEAEDHCHAHHDHSHGHGHDHHDRGHDHSDRDHGHGHHSDAHHEVEHDADKSSRFHRDNNYRAAVCHVVADAFVSVLVIIALCVIKVAGNEMNFLDPLVALVGACVIVSWSYTLIHDTAINLLDKVPDQQLMEALQAKLESKDGTVVHDLHVWRLGPGHLGAIISLTAKNGSYDKKYYLRKIRGFKALSHITIEIDREKE